MPGRQELPSTLRRSPAKACCATRRARCCWSPRAA